MKAGEDISIAYVNELYRRRYQIGNGTKRIRNEIIKLLFRCGISQSEIGQEMGLSRQRIWEIIKKAPD